MRFNFAPSGYIIFVVVADERFSYQLCDDDDECSTQIDLGSIFDEHVIDVSHSSGPFKYKPGRNPWTVHVTASRGL
jgi:hypothetical protein